MLEAVNYYHKALHLGCCSSPRSASGTFIDRGVQWSHRRNTYCSLRIFLDISKFIYGTKLKLLKLEVKSKIAAYLVRPCFCSET